MFRRSVSFFYSEKGILRDYKKGLEHGSGDFSATIKKAAALHEFTIVAMMPNRASKPYQRRITANDRRSFCAISSVSPGRVACRYVQGLGLKLHALHRWGVSNTRLMFSAEIRKSQRRSQ